MRKLVPVLVILLPILACLCLVGVYFIPPVHDRLAWRLEDLYLRVAYLLNPPAKAVFIPTQQGVLLPTVASQATSQSKLGASRVQTLRFCLSDRGHRCRR